MYLWKLWRLFRLTDLIRGIIRHGIYPCIPFFYVASNPKINSEILFFHPKKISWPGCCALICTLPWENSILGNEYAQFSLTSCSTFRDLRRTTERKTRKRFAKQLTCDPDWKWSWSSKSPSFIVLASNHGSLDAKEWLFPSNCSMGSHLTLSIFGTSFLLEFLPVRKSVRVRFPDPDHSFFRPGFVLFFLSAKNGNGNCRKSIGRLKWQHRGPSTRDPINYFATIFRFLQQRALRQGALWCQKFEWWGTCWYLENSTFHSTIH